MTRWPWVAALASLSVVALVSTQEPTSGPPRRPPPDPNAETFGTYCAGCHGTTITGGRAASLFDGQWQFGDDDARVATNIREGVAGTEMLPFKGILSDEEIAGIIGYIRDQTGLVETSAARARHPAGVTVPSERHAFRFEVVAEGLTTPWGMAFLPDGRLLVTERPGHLRLIADGQPLPDPIEGTPEVWTVQDGGLFDVAVHPDYEETGWVYLAYAEPGDEGTSMTTIVRGRIEEAAAGRGRWVDEEILYRAPPDGFWASNVHYGSRFLFDAEGRLFYSIGDRGREPESQDLSSPNGKLHRVNDDGSTPSDNPFVGRRDALGSIWSYGHRNPQGLAFHPVTGALWSTEHGPIGGDELNRIEPGTNYGWPLATHGRMGRAAEPGPTHVEGMEPPVRHWTPTIAPSGIAFYTGDRFPQWQNDLFVTGLAGEALRRLEVDGDEVVHEEVVFDGFGRVRDVTTGPDGYLYVALNVPGVRVFDTTPGLIVRLVPAD